MKAFQFSNYGIAAALDQINRELFDRAEDRLREKMKPARLAASQAVVEEFGREKFETRSSKFEI